MPSRNVRSGFALASLAQLRGLPACERRELLAGWVVWLAANRHRVSSAFERQLDRALLDLCKEDDAFVLAPSNAGGRAGDKLEAAREARKERRPEEDDA